MPRQEHPLSPRSTSQESASVTCQGQRAQSRSPEWALSYSLNFCASIPTTAHTTFFSLSAVHERGWLLLIFYGMSLSHRRAWRRLYCVSCTGSLHRIALIWRHASAFGGSNLTDEKEGALIVILLNQSSQFIWIFTVDYKSIVKLWHQMLLKGPSNEMTTIWFLDWEWDSLDRLYLIKNNKKTHCVSYKCHLENGKNLSWISIRIIYNQISLL